MNKEQLELLDVPYKDYVESYNKGNSIGIQLDDGTERVANIDEFIRRIRQDILFAEKWGLKFEKRELSLSERGGLFRKTYSGKSVDDFAPSGMEVQSIRHQLDTRYNKSNIPTKLITITYNKKTIESYE